jgi:hypothetical protein
MEITYLGLFFQIIFFLLITVFNFLRIYIMNHLSVYPVALFELFLGLASFICGIIGLIKKTKISFSIIIMLFGIVICVYFVFVYLLGEAGIPPAIPWLYRYI